jgi:hypothetical protein
MPMAEPLTAIKDVPRAERGELQRQGPGGMQRLRAVSRAMQAFGATLEAGEISRSFR